MNINIFILYYSELYNSITYSQTFTSGVIPAAQCTAWTTFVAQLTPQSYTSLTISGSFDTVGRTTTNSAVINGIALALRTSTTYGPTVSNGFTWQVGSCGNPYELSASGSICSCPNPGYIVRPCIGSSNWGGINGATCGAPTQTITVIFTY